MDKVYLVMESEYEHGYEDSGEIITVDSVYSDFKKARKRAEQILMESFEAQVKMYPDDNKELFINCFSPNGSPFNGLAEDSKYKAWCGNVEFGAWVEEHEVDKYSN